MTPSAASLRDTYVPPILSTRDVVERMAANPLYEAMITADFILPGRLRPQVKTWESIVEEVAKRHNMRVDLVMSRNRARDAAWARFDAWSQMYTTIPGMSLTAIARIWGLDHTTVMTGIRRYKELHEGGYMP